MPSHSFRIAALAAALACAVAPAMAAPARAPADQVVSPFSQPGAETHGAKGVVHVPVGTISNTGNAHVHAAAATFTNIDAVTPFTCASAKGCTILFSINMQGAVDADGGRWAICSVVDDLGPAGYCAYQGPISVADGFTIRHGQFEIAVAKGKHTVHAMVYFDQGGTVNNFSARYDIMTP